MSAQFHTYWTMVINNPTPNDYVIVRQPHSNHIRQIQWTPEQGDENGTPHIQAFIRMQRNATLGMMKKLYPRANFKPATRDEYILNAERYATKDDTTTRGLHTITLVDPIPAVDTLLYRVLSLTLDADGCGEDGRWQRPSVVTQNFNCMLRETKRIEDDLVVTEARLEKLFLSPSYDRMKRRFWEQIMARITNKRQADSVEIVLPVHTQDGEASSCGTDQEEVQEGSEDSEYSASDASEDSSEQGTDSSSGTSDEED